MFCKQRGGTEGSSSWHWDNDTAALPQTLACHRRCLSPSSHAQKDKEGPKGKAGSICVIHPHTHTFYPVKHLLLQSISIARHSTRNSWTELTARAKCNHFAALTGIFLCKVPPTPNKVSHALHILYSAEQGVLSRFLQTEKQVKSEVLHCKRFYIYTESTALVLSLKQQVKSQTGSFFILSLPSNCWTEEILASRSY